MLKMSQQKSSAKPGFSRLLLIFVFFLPSLVLAEQGLLWKIEGKGAEASYLFATIHSDDERVTQLADPVIKAFESSQSFSGEIDMGIGNLLKASQLMLITDGSSLQAMLEPKLYQQTVVLMASHGMPELAVRQMKPWAVAATLSLPKPRSGMFLDLMLYSQASQAGKKVYGLETVEEQVGSMESMPQKIQIAMLKDAVTQYEQLDATIEKLILAYLNRDLSELEALSNKTMQQGDKRVAEQFSRELVVNRNHRMLTRMQPRLREGQAFIAVGALHLPGDKGLLNLLRQQGYRVTAVY